MQQIDQFPAQPELSQPDHSEQEDDPIDSKQKKIFLPADYHKAKRSLTKLVKNYFDQLKEEVKNGAKLFLNRSKLEEIQTLIVAYVGVRYNDRKERLDLKLKPSQQSKTKQTKYGILSYVSESERIINYSQNGKVNIIQLDRINYKLPDIATPVPFQGSIFLLDPCNFDVKKKVFVPEGPAFEIGLEGKLKEVSSPILFRCKCAIVRRGQEVYLLGGYATNKKIITNRCQKFNLKAGKSVEIPLMTHKHVCPSACFMGEDLWVFSSSYLQCFNGKEWRDVQMPFGPRFLPFQFMIPISDQEILIFGGMSNSEKSKQVKVYNTKFNNVNFYGNLLPQGISSERSSGAGVINGCVVALSSIQASIYPQIGIKSNMTEVIYIFQSSAYLNSIITP